MITKRITLVAGAVLAFGVQAGAARAQQSIYINQIDPSPTAASRRTGSSVSDQVLLNSSAGLTPVGPASPAIPNVGAMGRPSSAEQILNTSGALTAAQTNNLAVLSQFGTNNRGTIDQSGQGDRAIASVYGNGNATTQTQSGNGSTSLLTISGDLNAVAASQTLGNNNYSAYNVVGNGNSITSSQTGSNLSYSATIIGSGKNITVEQNNFTKSGATR